MKTPPRPEKVQKAEQKARGLQSLANLRKSLDMPPLSESSQATMVDLESVFDSVGAGQ